MARDKKENATSGYGVVRCAIYTRKSTEEGLDQDFNSLDAQREAGEAYIRSQASEGWTLVPSQYDDGGYTGANIERPGMKRLLEDIQAKKVDCVVVYKVDRLSRSIRDFAKIMETFEKHGAQFVSVTQQFNTTSSLGRLTLNILLSFAQYAERAIMQSGSVGRAVLLAFRWCWTPHYPGSNKEASMLLPQWDRAVSVVAGTPRQRNPQPGEPSFGDRFLLNFLAQKLAFRLACGASTSNECGVSRRHAQLSPYPL